MDLYSPTRKAQTRRPRLEIKTEGSHVTITRFPSWNEAIRDAHTAEYSIDVTLAIVDTFTFS
jgi:hypothetical protein